MTPSISLRLRTAARSRTLALITSAVLPLAWFATTPATAKLVGEGADGQVLAIEYETSLTSGATVTGSGYDESKGIYVAVCVDNGEGARPTPCIGGVDMSGDGGASTWISSNPPNYGKDLVTPYGPDGSFEFDFTVQSSDDTTDCLDPADAPNGCVLASYADHTRLDDRSADVRIPLDFAAAEPEQDETTSEPAAEETTPEAAETPSPSASVEATDEPSTDATTTAVAADSDADEDSSGTPPEFWVWIGLAGIALIGAIAVIRTRANKLRAQEAAATGAADSDSPDTQQPGSQDYPDA